MGYRNLLARGRAITDWSAWFGCPSDRFGEGAPARLCRGNKLLHCLAYGSTKPDGVQPGVFASQIVASGVIEHPAGEQPLVRGSRRVEAFDHFRPAAVLLDEPADGLEVVHVEPHPVVEEIQPGLCELVLIAMVAHIPTDHSPVLLLDPGLIVLLVGSATGEPDLLPPTVGEE